MNDRDRLIEKLLDICSRLSEEDKEFVYQEALALSKRNLTSAQQNTDPSGCQL